MNQTTLDCGHPPSEHSDCTTGYGIDKNGKKHCYTCCGERDKADMRSSGKATLYLSSKPHPQFDWQKRYFVSNWPGSLLIEVGFVKKGRHNIAGTRCDVWFTFEGAEWHGVQYGENTQICHCKRVK